MGAGEDAAAGGVGRDAWVHALCLAVPACVAGEREVSMTAVIGDNVQAEVQDGLLVLTIDLSQTFGLSGSGKSVIIASTGGNVSLPGVGEVKIGLNVYRPVKQNGRG